MVQVQASSLAFIDTIRVLAVIAVCVVPLVLPMSKTEPGAPPPAPG
jgi:hypothetical protein